MIEILDLVNECSSPALGNVLTVFKRILGIIQIIGPIIFMVALIIHLVNLMSNPEDKKLPKKIFNSLIAIILLFFIPFLVNFVMGLMDESFSLSACWNSISTKNNGLMPTYIKTNTTTPDSIYQSPDNYEKGTPKPKKSSSDIGDETTDVVNTDSGLHALKFNGWDYYLYIPKNVNSNKPLIIFLHGNGDQGNNLEKLKGDGGFAAHLSQGTEYPAYVLLPQLPSGTWLGNESTLFNLIENVITTHGIDRDRISLSGFSMGANSVPPIVANHPNYFSSAVIMSIGSYSPSTVSVLKTVPTRIYYGVNDKWASSCVPLYNQLTAAGGEAEIFKYQNQGHPFLPKRVLDDTDSNVIGWMLSKRRGG